MLSLLTVFAMHIPKDMYLGCDDYAWLKERALNAKSLSVTQKIDFITHWANHTDSHCFDNKDAND